MVVVDWDADAGERTAAEIVREGGDAIFVQCDVSNEEQVKAMVQATLDKYRRLDVLVNNAGIGVYKSVLDASSEDWDRAMAVNLKGVFLCSKYAIPHMQELGKGAIVNISSVHEEACNVPNDGPYCVAKGGVRNLTRAMALEVAPHGITVNAVAPGMILTPMNQQALDDPEYLADAEAQIPLRRAGTPADIASMVLFLCSEHASYCTGGTYLVDGGWMLTWPPV